MNSIQINGRWVTLSGATISFAELVERAFGDRCILPAQTTFAVTVQQPLTATRCQTLLTLAPGTSVDIEPGLKAVVDVVPA